MFFLGLRFEVIKSLAELNGELCKHEQHPVAPVDLEGLSNYSLSC